jgi:hypothetical protein
MPGSFALPAGWGDVVTGLAAPAVALAWTSRASWRRPLAALWCGFGLLDLASAVTLGILNSPTLAGLLAGSVTTASLGSFRLALIPGFLVPLSVTLHLIVLAQLPRPLPRRESTP